MYMLLYIFGDSLSSARVPTPAPAYENGRLNLGVERAKVLATALKCHPAVLVFPGWEIPLESAA